MSSELVLVTQLAIILIAGSVFTVIFKALKQPVILGYIIAGFVVGPHLGLFPQFSPESVHEWSELGIIFLLFGLGLEFNFKKLLNVGSTAIIAAMTICLGMFLTGFVTGTALGWKPMERIFLGGMLGMSSTTIIIKAYDDLGMKNKPHSSLVFGLLVVEDLLAVLLMVLFSTLAVSNRFSGAEMFLSLAKLVIFLVIFFLIGIYVIPTVFKKAGKFISDEILLLISVGLCFLMVVLANKAGFSSALGAFLMGSILSSTLEGERIEELTSSIKNLFGAIFFVSVGMMVEPLVIAEHWGVILVITLVAMAGILLFSTAGVLFAGKSLDTALHVGFSLPQLGEFSFIIAGLGTSLGVLSPYIYPVIISVSVITTFTTPYMIKAADPVSAFLYRKLPTGMTRALDRRAARAESMNRAETSLWKTFVKKYFVRLSTYSIILLVILLSGREYLPKLYDSLLPHMSRGFKSLVEVASMLLVMSPFLFGLAVNGSDLRKMVSRLLARDPKSKVPLTAAVFLRIFLAVEFSLSAILLFVKVPGWSITLIFASLLLIFIIARGATRKYTGMEDRFFSNLNAKENQARKKAPVSSRINAELNKYDIMSADVVVPPDYTYVGQQLRKLPFRKESGVNVAKIQRGGRSILIPSGDEVVFPGDRLVVVGTKAQVDSFLAHMASCRVEGDASDEEFTLEQIVLKEDSVLVGMALKDTNLRPSGCLIVSIERDGTHFPNPDKEFCFKAGDKLWAAGLKSSLDWIKD